MSEATLRQGLHIAYLSGSPRIATRDDAEVAGPRSHILGLIGALELDGNEVDQFILGDRLPARVSGEGSLRLISGGRLRQLAVDAVRLVLRWTVARRARRELPGPFDISYERFALFQNLGRSFQRAGTPWVLETNAVIAQEAKLERNTLALQRVASWLERRAYRQADLIVCISEALRDMIVADAGIPVDRIVVLPNGVDLQRFAASTRPAGHATEGRGFVAGYVGWITERQGLDQLIRAVATLSREGVAMRAVLVGDGPDRRRLEDLATAEGIGDRVEFVGQVPWQAVPEWIEGFSVGYSGQRGVGGLPMYHSPLKIYEYLGVGRPVVASRFPDAVETLVAPRAGWVFTPGDEDALTGLLRQVAHLPEDELSAFGHRARQQVEDHHSWEHRSARLVEILEERGLVVRSPR